MIAGVRQFKLINGNGDEYDMTRPEALFFEPNGLGWGQNATVMKAGDGYILTDLQSAQPAPSGSMVFRTYQEYETFLAFLQVGSLTLCYMPISTWRYLDVIASIDKSEIDWQNDHLTCPMTFTALSGWYEKQVAYQAADSGTGKVYNYTYNYTYTAGASGAVEIANGNLESYPRIVIFGPATNPTWALYKGNDRLATGTANLDLPSGHKLIIDANPATMEIGEYLIDDRFVADRYGDSDFLTERFFMLPPGDCRVVFTQDGPGTVTAFVEVKKRV